MKVKESFKGWAVGQQAGEGLGRDPVGGMEGGVHPPSAWKSPRPCLPNLPPPYINSNEVYSHIY